MSRVIASETAITGTQPPMAVAGAPRNNPIDLAGVVVAIVVACGLWYVRKRRNVTGPELSWLYDALNVITVEVLVFLTLATFTPSTPWLVHAIAGASQLLPIVFVYCAGLIVRQMINSTKP